MKKFAAFFILFVGISCFAERGYSREFLIAHEVVPASSEDLQAFDKLIPKHQREKPDRVFSRAKGAAKKSRLRRSSDERNNVDRDSDRDDDDDDDDASRVGPDDGDSRSGSRDDDDDDDDD